MIAENGARTVHEVLTPGKMTIFPQASVHTMINMGCENAQLVSALSSDDAGTQNLANSFFRYDSCYIQLPTITPLTLRSLPAATIGTVLGQNNASLSATEAVIPPVGTGSNAGPEACLAACHKKGKMIKRTW